MQNAINKHVMAAALSDDEILQLVEGKARLITHDEIRQFKNIDQLLGKYDACIILYVTTLQKDGSIYGHWCGVFRAEWDPTGKTISYFDPYGNKPDYTLNFCTPQAAKEYGVDHDLEKMLKYAATPEGGGYTIVYNIAPLQKHHKESACCGRLTGMRIQFRGMDGNRFADMLNSYENRGLDAEQLCTLMTSFVH